MIRTVELGIPVLLLALSLAASRARDARRARALGAAASLAALLLAVLVAALGAGETAAGFSRYRELLPALFSLVGLVATAMTPLGGASPRTLGRTVATIGLGIAFVEIDSLPGEALLWAATALPLLLELRERAATRGAARLFLALTAPSAALFFAGALALRRGDGELGAVLLAGAVALRQGVFPLTGVLPRVLETAPLGLSVAFLAPELGLFAHVSRVDGLLPAGVEPAVAALGALTAVVAAALGTIQRKTRRAFAYLFLSQSSLVALGLDAHAHVARVGTLLEWLVQAVATAGLGMAVAALEARRGELLLDRPDGAYHRLPHLAAAFLLLGLASVGLPGTLGFVAEDLLVGGSVGELPAPAYALVVATALNGVTVMRNFFLLFTGRRAHPGLVDLTLRERLVLSLSLAVLLAPGWFPGPVVSLLDAAAPGPDTGGEQSEAGHHALRP